MISNTGCQWLRNTNMYICTTCNPLKFTKIIHLPRQIYVSNIKQNRDIIEARSFSNQPKTEPIPWSSTDKPLKPDPQRDEVNNQDEIYVEEEYFDCEEFLAQANSYNNQVARAVAKEHANFKLLQAEVVRKLGEYAIVYIGVIGYKVEVSSSSYVLLTSSSLSQQCYSFIFIVSFPILFRMWLKYKCQVFITSETKSLFRFSIIISSL